MAIINRVFFNNARQDNKLDMFGKETIYANCFMFDDKEQIHSLTVPFKFNAGLGQEMLAKLTEKYSHGDQVEIDHRKAPVIQTKKGKDGIEYVNTYYNGAHMRLVAKASPKF